MCDLNRGKRSIIVDLKKKEGVQLAMQLAKSADVLLEPYRPGVCVRACIWVCVCLFPGLKTCV